MCKCAPIQLYNDANANCATEELWREGTEESIRRIAAKPKSRVIVQLGGSGVVKQQSGRVDIVWVG